MIIIKTIIIIKKTIINKNRVRKTLTQISKKNKNVVNVKSFKNISEKKIESTNVKHDDVVATKKNEKNDEMKSSRNDVDENRASNNNSSNEFSFNEFFNSNEKKIASLITSQHRVVIESIFDLKSSSDFR
jgi:nucleoside diphosphate kinase